MKKRHKHLWSPWSDPYRKPGYTNWYQLRKCLHNECNLSEERSV